MLRLSRAGAEVVERLAAGEPIAAGTPAPVHGLIRRLVDGGLAHPRPPKSSGPAMSQVAVVIPVRDRSDGLERTLRALWGGAGGANGDGEDQPGQVIVVDDGSRRPVAPQPGVRLVRHLAPRGPAAARNTGWSSATLPFVAFLDADCEPEPGWLEPLLAHLGDPSVAAVAPRVVATGGSGVLHRYESRRSPLDLGPNEALVRPGSAIAYLPSAALVARRQALEAVGGFDEGLLVGEDVDLIWRMTGAGWRVRYEPSATVTHPARAGLRAWAHQRLAYGSSAGPLARRHHGAVPPLAISAWALAAWTSAALGWPAPAAAVAASSSGLLAQRLGALPRPWPEAIRLTARAHLQGGRALARAMVGAWWPFSLAAAHWRRARRAVLVAATVPSLVDWVTTRPQLDPLRWMALCAADDLCYGAGLWIGCWRARTVRPLVPRLLKWPGRQDAPREGPPAARRLLGQLTNNTSTAGSRTVRRAT